MDRRQVIRRAVTLLSASALVPLLSQDAEAKQGPLKGSYSGTFTNTQGDGGSVKFKITSDKTQKGGGRILKGEGVFGSFKKSRKITGSVASDPRTGNEILILTFTGGTNPVVQMTVQSADGFNTASGTWSAMSLQQQLLGSGDVEITKS